MAGAGRRTFAPGEVLTASNVMNYLQDQAVMNFAGTAARGSAIGTAVSEGMVSYLADTNSVQVYNGSLWTEFGTTSQISQITKTDKFSFTATTYANVTGLTVSITPSATNKRVLVMGMLSLSSNSSDGPVSARVTRNGSPILVGDTAGSRTSSNGYYSGAGYSTLNIPFLYIDSPSTTSSVTYAWQVKADAAGADGVVNSSYDDESAATRPRQSSSLIVMEIL